MNDDPLDLIGQPPPVLLTKVALAAFQLAADMNPAMSNARCVVFTLCPDHTPVGAMGASGYADPGDPDGAAAAMEITHDVIGLLKDVASQFGCILVMEPTDLGPRRQG
jgi:hypothetical protein